jgi:transmembrane sensor
MKELIFKYLEGKETEAESSVLLEWLRKRENRTEFNHVKKEWRKSLDKEWFPEDGTESWEAIQSNLLYKSYDGWQKTIRLQKVFRYAALFFFMVSLSSAIWIMAGKPDFSSETWSTVVADNGQISRLELPDGTVVWLNSGSRISYSNRFGNKHRKTRLTGEAFFDVNGNRKQPFWVECGDMLVKVHGTRFNVSAVPGEATLDVVLEEGAVELKHKKSAAFNYHIKPGELASFNVLNQKLTVESVNTSRYTSWKEGILNIYDQPITEVVKKLESRYNQAFELEPGVEILRYTFTIKNESLSDILQLMERISSVKATQKGNKIHLHMNRTKIKGAG